MNAQSTYVQGETATFTVADSGYASVTLRFGAGSAAMTLSGGAWTADVQTGGLSGRVNWAILADGRAVESGTFYVRPLVSRWKAVVDAIDAAMQKNAVNGKYTVTVGDISLTDKTFDEMVKFRAYYQSLADGDEDGSGSVGMPVRTVGVYA